MPFLPSFQRWLNERREQRRSVARAHLLEAMETRATSVKPLLRSALHHGMDSNEVLPLRVPASPLAWAVRHDQWDVVPLLLRHGANPNASSPANAGEWREHDGLPWPKGYTTGPVPLFGLAVVNVAHTLMNDGAANASPRMWRALELLLDHGADPSLRAVDRTGLDQALNIDPRLGGWPTGLLRRLAPNAPDAVGQTALHRAIRQGSSPYRKDMPGVRSLLIAGADPYTVDGEDQSALHILARKIANGDQHSMALLDLTKAMPTLDWHIPNGQGVTPWSILEQPSWDGLGRKMRIAYEQTMDHLRVQHAGETPLVSRAIRPKR